MKLNPSKLSAAVAILMVGRPAVVSFSFTSPIRSVRRDRGTVKIKNNEFSFTSTSTRSNPLTNGASAAKGTSTALEALPTWAYYSIGHVIGGMTGTPIVASATKTWYKRIQMPSWIPPSFLFAPVWTTLYALMGVSLSRIVKSGASTADFATKLWAVHYGLNLLWPPIFFGLKYLRLGLMINFFLVGTLGAILPIFHRIDPLSAYLQIPYLAWLLFATKLNQTICQLNPTLDGVNAAMIQAKASGGEYNDDMLQYDIKKLQADAASYAGL